MTRGMALVLTALTGFSGLVYEVAWEKYLATLLGSHSEATSAVLGIFLGGLSLGYALFGRITRAWVADGRGSRLLILYGAVEGGIGGYVLVFPWLFQGMLFVSTSLPGGATGAGFVLDVVLAAILIGPPSVLMGGTIPILTQALSRSATDATRFHALVYALNTAGAFAGALAAGFFLIPRLGLVNVMAAMGLVNLAAGLTFGLLGLRAREAPRGGSEPAGPAVEGFWLYALAAGLVGFAMMSLQTVLIRIGGLSLGASQFTFSMVVATFVLCIALGSLAVSAVGRIPRAALAVNQWLLVLGLLVLYLLVPDAPYAAHVLRTLFRDVDPAFYAYHAAVFLGILLFIGPAVALSGATLPLLFDHLRRQVDDLGAVAGRLYSWNTFGSLLGALVGGHALLYVLSLSQVYAVAVAALVGAAVLLGFRLGGRLRQASVAGLVLSLAGLMLLPAWNQRVFTMEPFRKRQPTPQSYEGAAAFVGERSEGAPIVFYEDDPVASVAVIEQKLGTGEIARSIINNGKSDGNSHHDYPTMGLAAVLPAMFADRAESAFVIGFGTGVTVGELTLVPSMQRVVVSEISPAVMNAAPLFDFANHDVTRSPKVEVLRTDAYRALLGDDARYDVIVSEPSNPWVQGVEMLFSREFLSAARDRLTPGGVYAQWFHQYETDQEALELVLRTYVDVFDRVSVWYGVGTDLILLGFREQAHPLDLPRLRQLAEGPVFQPALERSQIESFTELLGHELIPLGVLHAIGFQGRIHTLYEPILSYVAARAFYRGDGATLPFTGFGRGGALGRQNSLLARQSRDTTAEELFRSLCDERQRECVALLATWSRLRPDDPAVGRYVNRALRRRMHMGGNVTRDLVQSVSRLYRVQDAEPATGPVPLAVARRASAQYAHFYTHALPFSPRALIDLWERCEAPAGREDACQKGLADARRLLRHGLISETAY